MAPPERIRDPRAELELLDLNGIAQQAAKRAWQRAYELVAEERLTAEQAAHMMGVSVSTYWRRVRPWLNDARRRAQATNTAQTNEEAPT